MTLVGGAGAALLIFLFAGSEGGRKLELAVEDVLESDPLTGLELDAPNIGYRRGFTIRSDDDRFSVRLNGRVEPRYTYRDRDDAEDISAFRVRRARLLFRGHIFQPELLYRIQVSLTQSSDEGRTLLQDAYLSWQPVEGLSVRAGQFRAPFGRQDLVPSHRLQFSERTVPMRFFGLGRQIGMLGSYREPDGLYDVRAGIFNGDGEDLQGAMNDNNEMMFVARAQWNPTGAWQRREGDLEPSDRPAFSFGSSFVFNPEGPRRFSGTDTEVDTVGYGVDGACRYAGTFLTAELFRRRTDEDGGSGFDSIDENGFHVQGGVFLIPKKLEAAARYSKLHVDDGALDRETEEMGLSLAYFIVDDRFKFRLEWLQIETDRDMESQDTEQIVRFQWVLSF